VTNCNIRTSLLKCVDKILGVRELIGATIQPVDLITRTWSGERVGDGSFTETTLPIKPDPCIVDVAHDLRLTESGAVKAGDLIIQSISRNKFPDELTLRTDTTSKKVQKIYKVGKHFYHLVHIKEQLVTWELHIRKIRFDETEVR